MKTLLESVVEYFNTHSKEEIRAAWEKLAPTPIPNGWLSIDEYLPPTDRCTLYQEDRTVMVRDNTGREYKVLLPFGDPRVFAELQGTMVSRIGIINKH